MPPDEQPIGACFTVRRWRPEAGELDMLFVLHGVEGPAAARATGPRRVTRSALGATRGLRPASRHRLVPARRRDTGLPLWRRSSSRSPQAPGSRDRRVDTEEDRQPLPDGDGVEVQWCFRRGAPAGTTSLLADTVRALEWPSGTTCVWGGAESRCVTAVRKLVRTHRGLPRKSVWMTGYGATPCTPRSTTRTDRGISQAGVWGQRPLGRSPHPPSNLRLQRAKHDYYCPAR